MPRLLIVETEHDYDILGAPETDTEADELAVTHAQGYANILDAAEDKFYLVELPQPKTLNLKLSS